MVEQGAVPFTTPVVNAIISKRRSSIFCRPVAVILCIFLVTVFLLIPAISEETFHNGEVIIDEQNLIVNGDIEILDEGKAVGWKCSSVSSSHQNQNNCWIDSPGFQSDHALAMCLAGSNDQAKWEGIVQRIKPHTKYVLSFWYRLPEQGKIEVTVFDNLLSIAKMFRYNPAHWLRYSALVDSGDTAGDATITFFARNGVGRFSFSLDQIEMYEGESPIGKNCARMEYQYYDRAYVSKDIVSPLPFAFEWTFEETKKPKAIEYIVEFPSEVKLINVALGNICKWPPNGWSTTWLRWDQSSTVETRRITINDKKYTRVIARVPYVEGDEKQLKNYFVPVGIRDYWDRSLGRYSGMLSMTLYVRATTSQGSFPFYHYAKWDDGEQQPKKLKMEVTDVKKVKQGTRVLLISDVQLHAADKNPAIGPDFKHIGLNGIGSFDPSGGNEALKKKIGALHRSGMKYFSKWVNIASYGASDEEARAMNIDGKSRQRGTLCLSYRGIEWARKMDEYKRISRQESTSLPLTTHLPVCVIARNVKKLLHGFLVNIQSYHGLIRLYL